MKIKGGMKRVLELVADGWELEIHKGGEQRLNWACVRKGSRAIRVRYRHARKARAVLDQRKKTKIIIDELPIERRTP